MKKLISLVLCLSLLMSVAQLSAMADFVPTADELLTAGVTTNESKINETSTTETGSTSADKSATNADSTVNSENTVVANSNESEKGIIKSGSAMLTATNDVNHPSECSFTIDAINVMDVNANTILVHPQTLMKTVTQGNAHLYDMFPSYPKDNAIWKNWTGIRVEKRGNETDGFRYTVIETSDGCLNGSFGVDKEESFLLLVKHDYIYDQYGTQIIPIPNADWPAQHGGSASDVSSDGAGDTALISLNIGNYITDIKSPNGNSYGTVSFTRSRTFGIEAVNSFNNSANTILLYAGYWIYKNVWGLVNIVEYEKTNSGLDLSFNISDWAVVRIEKRGTTGNERYTCLQVKDPATGGLGYRKTDAYLLLIKKDYITANDIVLPKAALDESDINADSIGDTAKITFLGTDGTYLSNDSDSKKDKKNNFSYTGYYYSYVTFTTKEESKSPSKEMIADTSNDIKTASNSNIDFKLFDYNKNINYTNDYSKEVRLPNKNGDSTFDYSHNQYFSFQSDPIYVNYNCNTVRDPISMKDVNPFYDGGQFHINHATAQPKLYNGSPVLDLIYNAKNELRDSDITSIASLGFTEEQLRLDYLFGGKKDYAVTEYDPTNTILKYDENTKTYSYDSSQNAVDYSKKENRFNVRNYSEQLYVNYNDEDINMGTSFMPFNHSTYNAEKKIYLIDGNDCDYWFGMRMDFEFIQSADGKIQVTDESGNTSSKEMIFEFSGDDDVWVFVDDVLVLDLGGIHGPTKGSINFSTGVIEQIKDSEDQSGVNKREYNTTIKTRFTNAQKTPNGGWNKAETTLADYSTHKLSFFYLERGAGGSNCVMKFNLPTVPNNSLSVAKDVVSIKNENINANDKTNYTFKISRNDSNITNTEVENYTIHKKDGTDVTGNGTVTNVKDGNDYYEFTIKSGESIYFTKLDSTKQYKIEEIIDGKSYIIDTKSEITGTQVTGDVCDKQIVNVTPTTDSKTVKFTNTIQTLDINLNYYDRTVIDGKPADISEKPTVINQKYVGAEIYNEDGSRKTISKMIVNSAVAADSKKPIDNIIDTYSIWGTQENAVKTLKTFDNPHTGKKYDGTGYHTDCYGNEPNSGDKWITYYGADGSEINESAVTGENGKPEDVYSVNVWLYNKPKAYSVTAYQASSSDHLTDKGNGVYVAKPDLPGDTNKFTDTAYYNQRLGKEYSPTVDGSTNHLAQYGIPGYTGKTLSTAEKITKDANTTLTFSYWAFDEDGKEVASTDIKYNYRVTNELKLYAVYTGTLNENPGLTVSKNNPDVFVDTNGISKTRLNTMMNPYNCDDCDKNISQASIIYVLFNQKDDLSKLNNIDSVTGKTYLDILREDIKGILDKGDTLGKVTVINVKDVTATGFKYDVQSADGDKDSKTYIKLTNKNRLQFSTTFTTSALSGKRLLAFAGMKYNDTYKDAEGNNKPYNWIVSDNYIDYNYLNS